MSGPPIELEDAARADGASGCSFCRQVGPPLMCPTLPAFVAFQKHVPSGMLAGAEK